MKSWQRKLAVFLVAPMYWFGTCGVAIHAHEHGRYEAERKGTRIMQVASEKAKPVKLLGKNGREIELAALTPGCEEHDWACVTGEAVAQGFVVPKPAKKGK